MFVKKNLAVVGGGAAGTVAAWLLRDKYNVVLFEAGDSIGGHVFTHHVDTEGQGSVPVDMGVEYFNERISPNVTNLLNDLAIENYVAPSSFHGSFLGDNQYWSNIHLDGQLRESIQHELSRFQMGMSEIMGSEEMRYKAMSIGDYLDENSYSQEFINTALFPLISISTGCNVDLRSYSLMFFALSFNANLVSFFSPGYWRKVSGGMSKYLEALSETLGERVKLSTAVSCVKPSNGKVKVHFNDTEATFDSVIFATSAEVTLSLLGDATAEQHEILAPFEYHNIESVIHYDTSYLNNQKVPHYFNFRQFQGSLDTGSLSGSGSITRVIGALSPHKNITTPLMVTLDPKKPIDPKHIVKTRHWRAAKQQPGDFLHKTRLGKLQGKNNIWFCGVDTTLGGHEGAVASGMVIADRLGATYPYKKDMLAYIQFRLTKDIMGVKTFSENIKNVISNILFLVAKKSALHKSLSYKFIKDFIV